MLIITTKNYRELSKRASEIIADEINANPKLRICFSSGKTPVGMYNMLVKGYKNKKVNFSKLTCFGLDEYYPMSKKNPSSFYSYFFNNLFNRINVPLKNIHLLNGEAENPVLECRNYSKKFKKIDVCVLGIGVNGHIAFNEPGSLVNSHTRVIKLSPETISRNFKSFKKDNPFYSLSVGISEILSCKKIILLASGKDKADAVKKLIDEKVSKDCPVTYLKNHRNLIVIIDKDAGKKLK